MVYPKDSARIGDGLVLFRVFAEHRSILFFLPLLLELVKALHCASLVRFRFNRFRFGWR
jgi:hypothetical protein